MYATAAPDGPDSVRRIRRDVDASWAPSLCFRDGTAFHRSVWRLCSVCAADVIITSMFQMRKSVLKREKYKYIYM